MGWSLEKIAKRSGAASLGWAWGVGLLLATVVVVGAEPATPPPDPAQIALDAGLQALQKQDYGRAVEQLRVACSLQPYWLLPHEYLAVAYHANGQQAEARAQYLLVQQASADWTLAGQANGPELRESLLAAEVEAVFLINEARLAEKLPLLRPDPLLAVCAREHSLEMWKLDYCDHVSPTPGLHMARDRFRLLANQEAYVILENVGRSRSWRGPAEAPQRVTQLHEDFMRSPGHRLNILSRDVSLVGVGVAVDEQGTVWITENFVQPARQDRLSSE